MPVIGMGTWQTFDTAEDRTPIVDEALAASIDLFDSSPPVSISAVFPPGFTHPHLVAGGRVDPRAASLAAWPMQVTSREDAEQHRPVPWAIATAEVHDRIYQSSWRVIPI